MRRRARGRSSDWELPLDESAVTQDEIRRLEQAVRSHGMEPLDILTSLGIFDIVLVCRASSVQTVAHLLGGMTAWHTEALLATSHTRWELLGVGR